MAKNTIPGLKTGGGILSKLIGTVVVVALIVLVVKYPGDAASFVSGLVSWLGDAIDGVVSFLRQVTG